MLKRAVRRTPHGSPTTDESDGSIRAQSEQWEIVTTAGDVLANSDEIKDYQIIFLGRDSEDFLSDAGLEGLRDWLGSGGGSLVCTRGSPAANVGQRLNVLLPIRFSDTQETRFRIQLTERGRNLRWLGGGASSAEDALASLPSLAMTSTVKQTKPLSVVLATSVSSTGGDTIPVVTYQPFGMGRVVVVEGSGMWRWALLPPKYAQQERVYSSLWHSLSRWLVSRANLLPGEQVSLQADKVGFLSSEVASATLLIREGEQTTSLPKIELFGEDGKSVGQFNPVPMGEELGAYRVSFGNLPAGNYRAITVDNDDSEKIETAFEIRNPWTEQIQLNSRPDLLKRIAEASGGKFQESLDVDALKREFQKHVAASHPPQVRRFPAWDRWWILLGVFSCWATCWAVRRNTGLV